MAVACTEGCFDAGRRDEWCARCRNELRPLDALPRGERAAGYAVGRILGRGGFAYTYLAYDADLDRLLAIKEFYPEGIATRDASLAIAPRTGRASEVFGSSLESFLAEARRLARIRHPGVVQVVRYQAERGTAYLAMPYYAGETLQGLHDRRVAEGRLFAPADLVRMLAPVFDALEHLHAQSPALLHRDIKPDNIFVEERGGADHPLLIDFGAAREAVGKSRLSRVWTPGFAPYEQQVDIGSRQGPHTDVYALAATLYYVLTDVVPADAGLRLGGLDDGGDPLQPLATLRPDVPAAFSDALDRAMRMRTTERTQTIGALRSELETALGLGATARGRARDLEDEVARAEQERIAEEQRRREEEETELARQEEEARRALADLEARKRALEEARARERDAQERAERERQARAAEERRQQELRDAAAREAREREARDAAEREAARRREQEERAAAGARAREERERREREAQAPAATRRVDEAPRPTPDAPPSSPPPTTPAAPAAPAGRNRSLVLGIGGAVLALAAAGMLYVNGAFSGDDDPAVIDAPTAVAAPIGAVAPDTGAAEPSAADRARLQAEEDSIADALAGTAVTAAAGAPRTEKRAPTPPRTPTPAPAVVTRTPQGDLAKVVDELAVGRVDEQAGQYVIAARSYRLAITDAQALVRRFPRDPEPKRLLGDARAALARASRACQAERATLGGTAPCP
jgi:hypothetical protein